MDLTPELFEKTEFAERRKGYDIEQVETFMEDAGTALAQMLARVRHTEERAAQSESRLAQVDELMANAEARVEAAERRVQAAERAAADARAATASAAAIDENAEVEQAAKTLLMAKRTAEATVNEARGQAQSLLEDAQSRSERQLSDAESQSNALMQQAAEQAEAEYAARRAAALGEVQELEARRSQLADVLAQLDDRLAEYREDLARAAQGLLDLAEDPQRLGARPAMSLLPDEVIAAEPSGATDEVVAPLVAEPLEQGPSADVPSADVPSAEDPSAEDPSEPDPTVSDPAEDAVEEVLTAEPVREPDVPVESSPDTEERPGPAGASLTNGSAAAAGASRSGGTAVVTEPSYVDLTAPKEDVSDSDQWGPGSWSQIEADLDADEQEVPTTASSRPPAITDDRPTEAVSRADAPRDRFLEELDSAVNEAVELDDDAMTAFFEGSSESRARRFGWRR